MIGLKVGSKVQYLVTDLKEYWGRGDVKNYNEDKAIRAFKISYSDEVGTIFLFLFSRVIP